MFRHAYAKHSLQDNFLPFLKEAFTITKVKQIWHNRKWHWLFTFLKPCLGRIPYLIHTADNPELIDNCNSDVCL